MRQDGHVVGIITARGGSKRIPLKNIARVGGQPLVAWMIEAARKSRRLERIIVSTDHPEIARIARRWGAEVPFKRPARLATSCPSEWVTQHAVGYLEREEHYPVSVAVTLQPTAPFCQPQDIDACVELLFKTGADTVMTVRKIRERPEWMYAVTKDRVRKFINVTYGGDTGISQKLQPLFIPNGAVFATSRRCLMQQRLIIGKRVRVVIVPDERSLDIDEPIDLIIADVLARQMKVTKEAR
ncbi:MAG: cytidylyltransferase domain-containing protein [Candidatus Methylomirabilales bacterium]